MSQKKNPKLSFSSTISGEKNQNNTYYPCVYSIYPRTQMGAHILEISTHKIVSVNPRKKWGRPVGSRYLYGIYTYSIPSSASCQMMGFDGQAVNIPVSVVLPIIYIPLIYIWLVIEPTQLKKYESNWVYLSQFSWKKENANLKKMETTNPNVHTLY